MENGKPKNSVTGSIMNYTNVALAILAVVTAFNTYITTKTKDKLEFESQRIQNSSKELHDFIDKRDFENNLKFKLFEEVKDAIAKKDTAVQNAVLLIINEMLAEDSLFKDKLTTVLLASLPSLVRKQEEIMRKETEFVSEEKTKQQVLTSNKFVIDVFYLEEILSEAQPRAKKIEELLKEKYPAYTIRLRLLPRNINAKSGYRISANEIRYEPEEDKIATEVMNLIAAKNIFEKEPARPHIISYHTPNYISVFVRNM